MNLPDRFKLHFDTRKKISALVVSLVLLLTAALLYHIKIADDPCLELESFDGRVACYSQQALRIIADSNIGDGINYVQEVVKKNAHYTIVHLVMHVVGNAAYHSHQDLQKALAYIPEDYSQETWFVFDGYLHGVLQAYFLENGGSEESIRRVSRQSCSPYLTMSQPAGASRRTPHESRAEHCFHATGHALMAATANDVMRSLPFCDEFPKAWMQKWCYYGVFMENVYLPRKSYESHSPKPYAKSESMIPLCTSLEKKYRDICMPFVGQYYMVVKDINLADNLAGAFDQCDQAGEGYFRACVVRLGINTVPAVLKSDYKKIIQMCGYAGKEMPTCLYTVALGIKIGAAGPEADAREFCAVLDIAFKERCFKALELDVFTDSQI